MLSFKNSLAVLKRTNALLEGHFILSSGLHSSKYIQCAKLLSYPYLSNKICYSLSKKIKRNFKNIDTILSPAMGGIIIGYEIGKLLKKESIFCERVKKKFQLRRGFNIRKNSKVLIVEDVITTGGSVKEVMKLVKKAGGNIVGIGVLVDRSNGSISLHNNQYAVASMEAVSYDEAEMPGELVLLPIQKPGSRFL